MFGWTLYVSYKTLLYLGLVICTYVIYQNLHLHYGLLHLLISFIVNCSHNFQTLFYLGFEGEAKFKLRFKSGGAIDFGTAMLKAAQMGEAYFRL